MNRWLVYVLGIITGFILTVALGVFINQSKNGGVIGLELFEEPGEDMECSEFGVFQVVSSGCALAHAYDGSGAIVLIIPDENQHFYDDQKIDIKTGQHAQHVGTYRYSNKMGDDKTVPAVRIVDDGAELLPEEMPEEDYGSSDKVLFDKPGDCVSRKNFEVQEVLESGDAIAKEISYSFEGMVATSELEVLILAEEGSHFYNNQIVKAPRGTCSRQIGNYKYKHYGETKVIPIIAFK